MFEDLILDAECPRCGLVELDRDQAWLVIASEPSLSHYAFACPRCEAVVRHHADADIVEVLAPLLAVEMLDVPAEALEVRGGPALTTDDLIDFCLALDALDTVAPVPAR
jgi:hypothetical protein